MPKKALLFIIAVVLVLVPAAALAEGTAVNSNDLIDHAKDYDGTTIVYSGEVVGDILYRGDYAWLAVSDGNNTIGVYATAEQAKQISFVGGYGMRGDVIRVEGVFHRACAEHGGDMDLHADSVSVVTVGAAAPVAFSRPVVILAIALPLPAAFLLFIVWKRRKGNPNTQNSINNVPKT